jgi:thioredoxin 2
VAETIITCPHCGKRNRLRPDPGRLPRCAVCHNLLPWIVDADENSFDAEITAPVPVVIDFWAPWCGPCRIVSPALERLARAHAGHLKIVKLDIDRAQEIATRYRVQGIPLLVLMRDREEIDRLVGAAPESRIETWLARHVDIGSATPA